MQSDIDLKLIRKRYSELKSEIVKTPVIKLNSNLLDNLLDNTELYLKLEFFQHTGTFKARGALSVANSLSHDIKKYGITAASAGNHAIAASWAAKKIGVSAKVFMGATANPYRVSLAKAQGADVRIIDDWTSVFKAAEQAVKEEHRTFIHPFEGINTSLGTAGIGLELIEEIPNLDAVIVSIGGGGLISGIATSIKLINPHCKIYGVEPEGADAMYQSFVKGGPIPKSKQDSIVDSLSPPMTLPYSYSLCRKYVDEIVTLSDDEICGSLVYFQEEAKLAVEPAAAATLSAVIGPLKQKLSGKKVGLIICGANIDSKSYSEILERGNKYLNS